MELFYRKIGNHAASPIIILHGLFGAGENWLPIANIVAKEHLIILPDLRNHGRSPHSAEMDYDNMANDVYKLIVKLELKDVILIGHSMGGKTAMRLSLLHPELIKQQIIIDIAPRTYPLNSWHLSIAKICLSDVSHIKTPEELHTFLSSQSKGSEDNYQILRKNIEHKDGRYRWKFNASAFLNHVDDLAIWEWGLPKSNTIFIKGDKSKYIKEDDIVDNKIIIINNSSHSIHVDQPQLLTDAILNNLEK